MSVMAYPVFVERAWLLIVMVVGGFLMPIALEMYGYISPTWEIRPGGPADHGAGEMVSKAGALAVNGTTTVLLVIIASVATLVIAGLHAASIIGANRQAQHKLVAGWHTPAAAAHETAPSASSAGARRRRCSAPAGVSGISGDDLDHERHAVDVLPTKSRISDSASMGRPFDAGAILSVNRRSACWTTWNCRVRRAPGQDIEHDADRLPSASR
jgi:hypothetical protein